MILKICFDEIKEHEDMIYLALVDLKIVHWFVHTKQLKAGVKLVYIG